MKVCTVETGDLSNGEYFVESCNELGIEFDVFTDSFFDQEPFSFMKRVRIELENITERYDDRELVLCSDFRDVVIVRDLEYIEKVYKEHYDGKVVFGSDMFCYPIPYSDFVNRFPMYGVMDYPFLNAGVLIGYCKDVKWLFQESFKLLETIKQKNHEICKHFNEDGTFKKFNSHLETIGGNLHDGKLKGKYGYENDQLLFQILYLENQDKITIDFDSKLIHNHQYYLKRTNFFDVVFDFKRKILYNRRYNTYPAIFHTPGSRKITKQGLRLIKEDYL